VAFPIYVGDKVVNKQNALWRQTPSQVTDDQANEFYRELTLDFEKPLLRVQLNTDAPVQMYALLFVPAKAELGILSARREEGLKLYSRKVLIQDFCKDLLPKHFRFVQGVVDSEDLPLNISRETVQSNKVMERIKTALTHKVIDELRKLASDDKEKYAAFWSQFAPFIKEGVSMDYANRQKLYPLLRFHSSTSGSEWVSLNDYVGRIKPSQKSIYYLLSESDNAAAISPHLDYFRKEGVEVLYLSDPMDHFMINGIPEYEGFQLQSVDDPTLDLPKDESKEEKEPIPDDNLQSLISKFKSHLGDKVLDVRSTDRLVDSPARLIAQDGNAAHDMARIKRLIEKDFQIPKRVLEINKKHPIIHRLAALVKANQSDELITTCIDQLFESSLLLEGLHANPAEMIPRIQKLMEEAVKRS
ncbi:MAG: molecular chaperone HtpG, partial [Chloroflexi bacterium]|nr:molecular chaperone HtpG [Chloroflexota bacterium]